MGQLLDGSTICPPGRGCRSGLVHPTPHTVQREATSCYVVLQAGNGLHEREGRRVQEVKEASPHELGKGCPATSPRDRSMHALWLSCGPSSSQDDHGFGQRAPGSLRIHSRCSSHGTIRTAPPVPKDLRPCGTRIHRNPRSRTPGTGLLDCRSNQQGSRESCYEGRTGFARIGPRRGRNIVCDRKRARRKQTEQGFQAQANFFLQGFVA
mmetsp:Transcript_14377/g.36133  ORF Transcript_14377/g.36133 Transcript_14377/m.36133 type:complete len:209 (+) Transcript_14377:166-792(+)